MAYFRCIAGQSGNKATITVVGSSVLAGLTVMCSDGVTTLTKTFPSSSPYDVVFDVPDAGTWTVSVTVSGTTYTDTVEVVFDYSVDIGVFDLQSWLAAGGVTGTYANLAAVLADEEAVRRLFLVHDAVDYLAGRFVDTNITTIINNDLCAKWINLSDYALDYLSANAAIKTAMDTADKYFYGEWTLMPQVPKMTSNTAPYGAASASSEISESNRKAWNAFDGSDSTFWLTAITGSLTNGYIQYASLSPFIAKKVRIGWQTNGGVTSIDAEIQGSNDGTNWSSALATITDTTTEEFDLNNNTSYSYYRFFINSQTMSSGSLACGRIKTLQFYAWAPKGNVPVMTSNTAPYGTAFASSVWNNYQPWCSFRGGGPALDGWVSNTANSGYIGYIFTAPVCLKHFSFWAVYDASKRVKDYTIDGSNDGSTWDTLYTGQVENTSVTELIEEDVVNDDYYIRYRINILSTWNSSALPVVRDIQFYGRELKASVPTMTSNSAPFGEVRYSSQYNTDTSAYKAMDGNSSTHFATVANDANGAYLGYHFVNPVIVKEVKLTTYNSNYPTTGKIQGTNDGSTWVDLKEISTPSASTTYNFDISNNAEYSYYRFYCLTSTGVNINIVELQFYGLDYSEKEFANDGSKWLYDHGVELETATAKTVASGSFATKESNALYMGTTATAYAFGGFIFPSIDYTNYSFARMKIGNKLATSNTSLNAINAGWYSSEPTYNVEPVANFGTQISSGNLPNNISGDCSSLNQSLIFAVVERNSSNSTLIARSGNVTEIWLEP